MTNLEDGRGKQQKAVGLVIGVGAQAKITRGTLLFPAPIYSPGGPRNPKRHKNPNRWIRLIQRFASLRAQKTPSLMRVTSIAQTPPNITSLIITPSARDPFFRLFGCTISRAWKATVPG